MGYRVTTSPGPHHRAGLNPLLREDRGLVVTISLDGGISRHEASPVQGTPIQIPLLHPRHRGRGKIREYAILASPGALKDTQRVPGYSNRIEIRYGRGKY